MQQTITVKRTKYTIFHDHNGSIVEIHNHRRKRNPVLSPDEKSLFLKNLDKQTSLFIGNNVRAWMEARQKRLDACRVFSCIADGGELRISLNGAEIRFNALGDGLKRVRITADAQLPSDCGHKELARISGKIRVHGYDCDESGGHLDVEGKYTVTRSHNGNFFFVKEG